MENGARRQFPDFFTFDKMGYLSADVVKVKDDVLNSLPMGPMVKGELRGGERKGREALTNSGFGDFSMH